MTPLVAGLLAPPTAIVGLILYLGTRRQEFLLLYFGLDPSVVSYSVQDYLLRSADVMVAALVPLISLAIAALTAHATIIRRIEGCHSGSRGVLWAIFLGQILGVTCFLAALINLLGVTLFLPAIAIAPTLGVGVISAAYSGYLRSLFIKKPVRSGWLQPLRAVLIGALLFISVFLVIEDIAESLGRGRAEAIASNLGTARPGVIVYSEKALSLEGPGITETRLSSASPNAYNYRYEGMRLLLKSRDGYILLPARWTVSNGSALLLRDDPGVRVDFTPPGIR